ncbi:hypothetical protein BFL43_04310 [Williamsia sp. 1135]|nr:hypothetical protein BFL43_04310 [Williamsia sp. 1135]
MYFPNRDCAPLTAAPRPVRGGYHSRKPHQTRIGARLARDRANTLPSRRLTGIFGRIIANVIGCAKSGYFSRELHSYGREGLPCHRCDTPIRREAFMNRSSFYCPKCQRPSRQVSGTRR